MVRNALRLTANLMSARESYSDKTPDFVFWAWDQVQNGLYETEERQETTIDVITGERVTKTVKIIKKDDSGKPHYQKNPLEGMGITLANFEVKSFAYEEKVMEQISTQQEAFMAVQTARAKAQKAEQDAKTKEAEGKAKVMEAKYETEQEKVKAVVAAEKEKEVAETKAEQQLAVAKLAKEAAEYTKEANILEGEGEAKKKSLIIEADGALKEKLAAYMEVNRTWAEAVAHYNGQWVPAVVMSGQNGHDVTQNGAQTLMDFLTAKTARDLSLDLSVPHGPAKRTETSAVAGH